MTKQTKKAFVALLVAVALVSFGCAGSGGTSDDDTNTAETAEEDITPTTGEPTEEPLITQSTTQPPLDVDILFVLDTSGSLQEERAAIAAVVQQFAEELKVPTETLSFTVAFTLGWISEDPLPGVYDGSGRLYRTASAPAAVLSSNSMTTGEIVAAVADTLVSPTPTDAIADGGEAGLYSLNLLLTTYRDEARALGFLRPGAALVVIFLSDENDICSLPPNGIPPVPDPGGVEEAARQTVCGSLTPSSVLEAARSATTNGAIQFSGIVYTGPDVPSGVENGIGYGYLEAISLTEGVAVDLASADFNEGARNLGNTINALAANLQRRFVLTEGPVNPLSIEVLVDGEAVEFEFIPEENAVLLAFAGNPGSLIEITYRVLDE